jgi:Protein of unknown function (DUF1573)
MIRCLRYASHASLGAFVVLVGLCLMTSNGGVRGYGSGLPELSFRETSKSFGEAQVGTAIRVPFAVTNHSNHPFSIVGSSYTCFPGGCVWVDGLPLEVPPASTLEVPVVIQAKSPAEFHGEVTVITNDPGITHLVLRVEGVITPRPAPRPPGSPKS